MTPQRRDMDKRIWAPADPTPKDALPEFYNEHGTVVNTGSTNRHYAPYTGVCGDRKLSLGAHGVESGATSAAKSTERGDNREYFQRSSKQHRADGLFHVPSETIEARSGQSVLRYTRRSSHDHSNDNVQNGGTDHLDEDSLRAAQQKIRDLEMKNTRLIEDSLRAQEYFIQKPDEDFQTHFQRINRKTSTLVKELIRLLGDNFFDAWEQPAQGPPELTVLEIISDGARIGRKKMLMHLRWRVWHFIIRSVVNKSKPFQTFRGRLEEQANKAQEAWVALFPDEISTPSAVKWRNLSVEALESREDDGDKDDVYLSVATGLNDWMSLLFKPSARDIFQRASKEDVLREHLWEVAKEAVDFGRQTLRQRALYSLEGERRLWKEEDDEQMTNVGTGTGVTGIGDDEENAGTVIFLASPALMKWGNGRGEHLEQSMVLVKAVVTIDPAGGNLPEEGRESGFIQH